MKTDSIAERVALSFIDKKKTPTGDENPKLRLALLRLMKIDKKKTPTGDENIYLLFNFFHVNFV